MAKGRGGDRSQYREAYELLKELYDFLSSKGLKLSDLLTQYGEIAAAEAGSEEILIPCSIFTHKKLGALEAITFYLRENKQFSFKKISELLARPHTSLRRSHFVAKQKLKGRLVAEKTPYFVPATLFSDRSTSVQRHLVRYLHDYYKLTFSQIARLLARDQRTIWTAYHAKRGDTS